MSRKMKKRKVSRPAFHSFETLYEYNRKRYDLRIPAAAKLFATPQYFYDQELQSYATIRESLEDGVSSMDAVTDEQQFQLRKVETGTSMRLMDYNWYLSMRPYYKVWPGIVSSLVKASLQFGGGGFGLPFETLCLRFCKNNEPVFGQWKIASAIVDMTGDPSCSEPSGIAIRPVLFNERETRDRFVFTFPLDKEVDIEENLPRFVFQALDGSNMSQDFAEKTQMPCLRLAVAVMLLAKDPSIIEPEVLAKDEAAYLASGDPKYVERAKRRGIHGFHIGRQCETMPHCRRPHFAIRWMGHGEKKVPRLRAIKGSVVHRKFMTQVPTGYITPDNVEVEVQE